MKFSLQNANDTNDNYNDTRKKETFVPKSNSKTLSYQSPSTYDFSGFKNIIDSNVNSNVNSNLNSNVNSNLNSNVNSNSNLNSNYIATEKMDGVRAHWNGKKLLARRGGDLKAPSDLVRGLPDSKGTSIVGELMASQGDPEKLKGLVRASSDAALKTHEDQQTQLFLFENLNPEMTKKSYTDRLKSLHNIVKNAKKSGNKRVKVVPEFGNAPKSQKRFEEMMSKTNEGLIFTKNNAPPDEKKIKMKRMKTGVATVLAASCHKSGSCHVEASMVVHQNKKKKEIRVHFNVGKKYRKMIFRGSKVPVVYRVAKHTNLYDPTKPKYVYKDVQFIKPQKKNKN